MKIEEGNNKECWLRRNYEARKGHNYVKCESNTQNTGDKTRTTTRNSVRESAGVQPMDGTQGSNGGNGGTDKRGGMRA